MTTGQKLESADSSLSRPSPMDSFLSANLDPVQGFPPAEPVPVQSPVESLPDPVMMLGPVDLVSAVDQVPLESPVRSHPAKSPGPDPVETLGSVLVDSSVHRKVQKVKNISTHFLFF